MTEKQSHKIISIDTEKIFDKIQHAFMIKHISQTKKVRPSMKPVQLTSYLMIKD